MGGFALVDRMKTLYRTLSYKSQNKQIPKPLRQIPAKYQRVLKAKMSTNPMVLGGQVYSE